MRAIAPVCLLPLATVATAEPTIERRIDILWDRADAQIDFGKFDDALQTGRYAVEIAPDSPEAWALLSFVRWISPRGLEEEAAESAARAVVIEPGSARGRFALGPALPWVTDPPDFEAAIAHGNDSHPALAWALARQGRDREARAWLAEH